MKSVRDSHQMITIIQIMREQELPLFGTIKKITKRERSRAKSVCQERAKDLFSASMKGMYSYGKSISLLSFSKYLKTFFAC